MESRRRSIRDLMARYKEIVIPNQKDQRNPKRHADYWIDRLRDLKLSRLSPAVLIEACDEKVETILEKDIQD